MKNISVIAALVSLLATVGCSPSTMKPTQENFDKVAARMHEATQSVTAREGDDAKASDEGKKHVEEKLLVDPFKEAGFNLDATLKDYAIRVRDGNATQDESEIVMGILVLYKDQAPDLARWGFIQPATKNLIESVFGGRASKPIEPFGGLSWNDGIVETIAKINKMEGIETVCILENLKPGTSLKGLASDSAIVSALAPSLHGFTPPKKFKDKDGTECTMATGIEALSAEPVTLKGLSFRLQISFELNPGLAIVNPNGVLQVNGITDWRSSLPQGTRTARNNSGSTNLNAFCPFAISKVVLSCRSPALPEKNKELLQLLKERFKAYRVAAENDYGNGQGYFNVEDNEGATISTQWYPANAGEEQKGGSFTITYARNLSQLEKIYEKHLSDLEEKKLSTKPDKSNDL